MNQNTLLLRHIHPTFVQNGRVSSQAFRPTPKDEQLLSVYDGDQIDAPAAYLHYTGTLKLASVGVIAVTVDECLSFDLAVRPDPTPFPEHVVIDFSSFTRKQAEMTSKQLRSLAEKRSWLYQA